jgi:hypothetical protein
MSGEDAKIEEESIRLCSPAATQGIAEEKGQVYSAQDDVGGGRPNMGRVDHKCGRGWVGAGYTLAE